MSKSRTPKPQDGLEKDDEAKILACLKKDEYMPIDVICNRTGIDVLNLNITLIQMEMKRMIESAPGKFYRLK